MGRNRRGREVVAYLLAMVAGALLLPVISPVIICTNASGYPDEDSSTLGIQSVDGVVSILTAFANVVVFAASIRGIAFDGGTVLDSPLLRVDRDGLVAGSALEPTPTEVPIHTCWRRKQEHRPQQQDSES